MNIINDDYDNNLLRIEEIKDLRKFPLDKMIYLILSYVLMLFISFLKGSEHMNSFIHIEVYFNNKIDVQLVIG